MAHIICNAELLQFSLAFPINLNYTVIFYFNWICFAIVLTNLIILQEQSDDLLLKLALW